MPRVWMLLLALWMPGEATARVFQFENLTDRPGGPGEGKDPQINDRGDVAFFAGTEVWLYQEGAGSFTEITALPGAPAAAIFPKINSAGDLVMIDPGSRDLWLYEADTGSFTNLSSLPGHPGNTENFDLGRVFDLNDSRQVSFHSGDRNLGRVWLYDHATGGISPVTGRPGGALRGRTNALNDQGQVLYMGFPDAYLYDPATDSTVNVNDLPGGPQVVTDNLLLSNSGDVAWVSTDVTLYRADLGDFLSLASLPGFPASFVSTNRNGLNERREIVFWKDATWYFDPSDSTFTQLNGRPGVPAGGMEGSINEVGVIAFTGGTDVFLAIPDADLDGVRDDLDNCSQVANADQADVDAGSDDDSSLPGVQHYGDACDADLDDDGLVGPSDFFAVFRPCLGADVTVTPSCLEADLDGDGVVAPADFFTSLRPALGLAPGPGVTEP